MPGELIVAFERGASTSERRVALAEAGAARARRLGIDRAGLVRLGAGAGGVRAAAAELRGRPGVRYAQPNFYRSVQLTPDDPQFGGQWGLHNTGQSVDGVAGTADADIDAPEAWDRQTGSAQVVVAVVDTGIDHLHPDLSANVWSNPGEAGGDPGVDDDGNGRVDDVRGWDFVRGGPDPQDFNGHGTHLAGTIGAAADNATGIAGISWDVSLMPVRALDEYGAGTDADIARAIDYAASEGADVINASFGGPDPSPVIADAIANHPGILFVAAAGNAGTDNDQEPSFPCNIDAENVVCVAASDQFDELAGFSNFGSESVDLAAPGVNVRSTLFESQLVVLLQESFEAGSLPSGWLTGGVNDSWAVTGERPATGDWGLSDSPGGSYLSNTDSFVRTPQLDASGLDECQLEYELTLEVERGYDFLLVEASDDADPRWMRLGLWSGRGSVYGIHDATAFDGSSSVRLRHRLISDGRINRDGAYVDDVFFSCFGDKAAYTYEILDGTSMAAPHVAGVAALLLAERPGASVSRLRAALLEGVDAKASLADEVASGGRLNAAGALAQINPPNTSIDSGPSGPTRDSTPTFAFSSDPAGASFECSVDSAPFGACSGPGETHTTAELADGAHTFAVRASQGGLVDPTPAERSFTVDTVPPDTEITAGPEPGEAIRVGPSFSFVATGDATGFACRIDSRLWQSCSSPRSYPALADGERTFRVAARDAAGNQDPTPAARSFTLDTEPPALAITGHPPRRVITHRRGARVRFAFAADEPSRFLCRVDRRRVRRCASPKRVVVGTGLHVFRVRATDAAGNHSRIAKWLWRVIRR